MKHPIEVRRYEEGFGQYSMTPKYTVERRIKRKTWLEQIGNFSPMFCRYNGKRTLVSSDSGDVSDPFRRDSTYLTSLFISV